MPRKMAAIELVQRVFVCDLAIAFWLFKIQYPACYLIATYPGIHDGDVTAQAVSVDAHAVQLALHFHVPIDARMDVHIANIRAEAQKACVLYAYGNHHKRMDIQAGEYAWSPVCVTWNETRFA